MIRKVVAIVVCLISIGITFFDQLYKLGSIEWIPEIVGPLLIVVAMHIWNPEWLQNSRRQSK